MSPRPTRGRIVPVVGLVDVKVELIPTDELRAFNDRMTAELRRRNDDERGFSSACTIVRANAQNRFAPAKVSVVGSRIICESICTILDIQRTAFAERVQAWVDSP